MRVSSARRWYSHTINEPLTGIFPFRADQKKCHQIISSAAREICISGWFPLLGSDHCGFIFHKFHFLVWREIITSRELTQPQIIATKIGPAASIGKKFYSSLPAWNYCTAWVHFSSIKIITPESKTEEIIHCKYLYFYFFFWSWNIQWLCCVCICSCTHFDD